MPPGSSGGRAELRGSKPQRGRRLLALGAAVLLAHLWLAGEVGESRLGAGAADRLQPRIAVAFVHELKPAAPPPAQPPQAPPVRHARLPALAPVAGSAAAGAEPLPVAAAAPEPEVELQPPLPLPELAPPPPAPAAPRAVDWPPSTRLSYRLSGNYRGPVDGRARVEWLRSGTHYEVLMEASIGPSFLPLRTRRDRSVGEIGEDGLSPRRYELEDKFVLHDPRRTAIVLDPDRIVLPDGTARPRPSGVQDAVSQFVQMTWLFTTQPELLATGRSLEIALALPRGVEPWTYDVLEAETLDTPAGPVLAVHVKPRREPRAGANFTAEMWYAPSLQYLPARIVVRQDADTWVDLAIDRLPQQAEPAK